MRPGHLVQSMQDITMALLQRALRMIFCVNSIKNRLKEVTSAFMLALSLPNVETHKLLPLFMHVIQAQIIGGVLWEYTPADDSDQVNELIKHVWFSEYAACSAS